MMTDNRRYDGPIGLAALDPTVAAYKSFIEKNKNQPIYEFLNSQQGQKVDPNLAAAMIVLKEMEDAKKNAPTGPMPTTSVVQDVGQAGLQLASQMKQQDMRNAGMAALPAPAMDQAQFQGGIADIAPPIPQMDGGGIKQMAGGGPIAFDEGGAMPRPSMTSQLGVPGSEPDAYGYDPDMTYILQQEIAKAAKAGDARRVEQLRQAGSEYLSRQGSLGASAQRVATGLGNIYSGAESSLQDLRRTLGAGQFARPAAAPVAAPAPVSGTAITTAAAAPPPAGMIMPDNAGSAFDAAIANARTGVNQGAGAPPAAAGAGQGSPFDDLLRANAAQYKQIVGGLGGVQKQVKQFADEAAAAKPREESAYLDDVNKTYEKLGIGQATQNYLNKITAREADIKEDYRKGRWLSVAQAGFAMAQAAAANPRAGFLGALAVGGMEGAKEYTAALKDYRKSTSQLEDARFAVAQAQENLAINKDKEARQMYNNAMNRYDSLREKSLNATLQLNNTLTTAGTARYTADANVRATAARLYADPTIQAYNEQRASGKTPTQALSAVTEATSEAKYADRLQLQRDEQLIKNSGGLMMLNMLENKVKTGKPLSPIETKQLSDLRGAYRRLSGGDNPLGLKMISNQ